jgi:hypothetical protein
MPPARTRLRQHPSMVSGPQYHRRRHVACHSCIPSRFAVTHGKIRIMVLNWCGTSKIEVHVPCIILSNTLEASKKQNSLLGSEIVSHPSGKPHQERAALANVMRCLQIPLSIGALAAQGPLLTADLSSLPLAVSNGDTKLVSPSRKVLYYIKYRYGTDMTTVEKQSGVITEAVRAVCTLLKQQQGPYCRYRYPH